MNGPKRIEFISNWPVFKYEGSVIFRMIFWGLFFRVKLNSSSLLSTKVTCSLRYILYKVLYYIFSELSWISISPFKIYFINAEFEGIIDLILTKHEQCCKMDTSTLLYFDPRPIPSYCTELFFTRLHLIKKWTDCLNNAMWSIL